MRILSVVTRVERGLACWVRISNLARALELGGHEVVFGHYCPRGPCPDGSTLDLGATHMHVVAPRPIIPFVHLSHMLKGTYDIVFANMQFACMYSLLGRATGVPLVFDRHGDIGAEVSCQNDNRDHPHRSALYAGLGRAVDDIDIVCSSAVTCPSRSMIDALATRGFGYERLIYVTNGADLDFFRPQDESVRRDFRERLGIEDSFVIGYLGGTARWQGVDRIVQAADCLSGSDIKVLVVGGSKEKMAARNVVHVPRVPSCDMPSYYSACDVLVLPRPSDPATVVAAPTKFAEYAAMGKPILTTPVGDPARFVREHECGLVTSGCSPSQIAEGAVQLKSAGDQALRKMGANARELAELEYDWRIIGRHLLAGLGRLQ